MAAAACNLVSVAGYTDGLAGRAQVACARNQAARPRTVMPLTVGPAPARWDSGRHHAGNVHPTACNPRCSRMVSRMGIRAVENIDASFELAPEAKEALVALLTHEKFCAQVCSQPGVPAGCKGMEFTGMLFQPVGWTVNTRFGMPQEYEQYHHDKENYTIINVPPTFMFKAKIFKPSRLCAIYKVIKE